jgi:hypothetical protein
MKTITISVDQYGRDVFKQVVPVEEAQKAAQWLIDQNGHAPEAAKILLYALKLGIERAK